MKQLKSRIVNVVISITLAFTGFILCLYLNDLYMSYQASNSVDEGLNHQDSLKVKVLQYGDTIAYQEMKNALHSQNLSHEMWFYSIVMAKQYHYPQANNDVCEILNSLYKDHESLGGVDSLSKVFLKNFTE